MVIFRFELLLGSMKSDLKRLHLFACLFLVTSQLCCASPFVTFIIPSGGRRSIVATLDSLQAQTDKEWNAVVVFDGLEPQIVGKRRLPFNFLLPSRFSRDKRIIFYNLPTSVGNSNCGAGVRNAGLLVVRTPWVAFVDDDDTLSPMYVRLLRKEVKLTGADLVVFRMHNERMRATPVLPPPDATDLEIERVGISFAYRHDPFDHRKRFRPSGVEDFDLLHRLCSGTLKCVISPYLTYFVHGKDGALPIIQGNRVILPRRSVQPTPPEDWRLRWGKASCFREPQEPIHHPFVFTEEDDLIFGKNVAALNASLERAVRKGCLRATAASEVIHVIFGVDTPPSHRKYIQIQMLQQSSKMVNAKYRKKLEASYQIWEMTPGSGERLLKALPAKENVIYSVPGTTYIDPDDAPITCHEKQASDQVNGEFYSYESKCYKRWSVKQGVFSKASSKASTRKATATDEATAASTSFLSHPDVLVYGGLNCILDNRREEICDLLQHPSNGFTTACLNSVFGAVLEHFICLSKVIVIDSFNEGAASLSTHRIDALLLAGKIIVSTPSSLPSLHEAYEDFIFLVEKEEIPATVKNILEKYSDFQALAHRQKQRFVDIVRNVDPLCYALRGIT